MTELEKLVVDMAARFEVTLNVAVAKERYKGAAAVRRERAKTMAAKARASNWRERAQKSMRELSDLKKAGQHDTQNQPG